MAGPPHWILRHPHSKAVIQCCTKQAGSGHSFQLSEMKPIPTTARSAPSHALIEGRLPVLSHTMGRTRIGAREDRYDTIPTWPLSSAAIKRDMPRPVEMAAPTALIANRCNENAWRSLSMENGSRDTTTKHAVAKAARRLIAAMALR